MVGRDLVNGQASAGFHGSVNDVQLFDYALTAGQVSALYNSQLEG